MKTPPLLPLNSSLPANRTLIRNDNSFPLSLHHSLQTRILLHHKRLLAMQKPHHLHNLLARLLAQLFFRRAKHLRHGGKEFGREAEDGGFAGGVWRGLGISHRFSKLGRRLEEGLGG